MRVVSLVPSVTETLLAWGITPIACTRFCEQPQLRHVGGTKDPDVAAIVALQPELVVLDREENRREDADALAAAGLALHVTHVTSLVDVSPTLRALANAIGLAGQTDQSGAVGGAEGSASDEAQRASAQGEPAIKANAVQRTAFIPIWRRPWMTINRDTYGSSLLAACGVSNVFAEDAERYPVTELDAAAGRRPDLVIAPSEPYPFTERHVEELRTVAADVRLVDGRDLFWWGVRTPGARRRLAQSLTAT